MRAFILCASIFCTSVLCFSVRAENLTINIQEIPVTANPLQLPSHELVSPIHIINGRNLQNSNTSSLGENLDKVPGVSNSSWGDSVGRPLIRGMGGNRVKILTNGMAVNDVSSMSGDHAVVADSISSEQIEIIRGPASVIYGGGSVGGTINIIDRTIPGGFTDGLNGVFGLSHGGSSRESTDSLSAEYGFRNVMFHFDGFKRDSKNLKIPGNSVSSKLSASRALEGEPLARSANGKNTLNSSYNDSYGGAFGASYILNDGYTGFSYKKNRMEYGNPIENGGKFDVKSDRYDYVYENNNLTSAVSNFKFKTSYSDYEHAEIEPSGTVGSDFFKSTYEGKFELSHSFFNQSAGVIGLDFGTSRFTKDQGAPMIANNDSKTMSLYLLENFSVNDQGFIFGFRQGYTRYNSNDFSSDDGCTVDYTESANCEASGGEENSTNFKDSEKTFNTSNISLGTSSQLNADWLLQFNLSHTQRAPAHNELFSYGHHHATETIEHGNRGLSKERSNSIDTTIKWSGEKNSFSVSPFYTRFNSYIAMLNSGKTQKHLHEGEEESEEIGVYEYQNIPAEFYGFEFQSDFDLSKNYSVNIWGDYVRAKNRNGENLPRISPLTLGGILSADWGNLKSDLNIRQVFSQNKTTKYEMKTDDYLDLTLDINYRLPSSKSVSFFIKAKNLLDQDIRNHTSFIKDQVLSGGRSIKGGISISF